MAVTLPIYMDHHATTPLDRRVLEAMMPYLTREFGNASSRTHEWGWRAEQAVDHARQQIADTLCASAEEVIFTSGATEANNMAIKGIAWAYRDKGNHLIVSRAEHKAILDPCKTLEKQGFEIVYLPVDRFGMVSPDEVRDALTDRTILVSVLWANNEIGTINPIAEIGAVAHDAGVLFHTDGVQAFGKYDSDADALNVDLMSLSAHKIYGPKGIGALYIRKKRPRIKLVPLMDGGGHERRFRSGTLNVPGIVGFGQAAALYQTDRERDRQRIGDLRDRLQAKIMGELDFVALNGHPTQRLYGNLNLSFEFVEGEALLTRVRDVALSTGSACESGSVEASHVLSATGLEGSRAHGAVRFGLGRSNTTEETDFVAETIIRNVQELRAISPFYEMKRQESGLPKR